MANTRIDVDALHGALEAARGLEGLSWRELARIVGVSASTMSRLAQGQNPDVNAFAKMVRWLKIPADTFIVDEDAVTDSSKSEPALVAQLAPLLRARSDLKKEDVELIESLIESAVRKFAAERERDAVRFRLNDEASAG